MCGILLSSRIDDPQMIEIQCVHSDAHGFCHGRRLIEFKFYTISTALNREQKIKLGAAVGRPEKGLRRLDNLQRLFQCKAFPRGADPWMPQKAMVIGEA